MIEQGDLLTLEDNKEYVVAATTAIEGIVYVYLIDQNDYSNFMFCSYDQTDGLYEVEDPDLLQSLIKTFTKQLTKFIDAME
jgi:hypothetical protein